MFNMVFKIKNQKFLMPLASLTRSLFFGFIAIIPFANTTALRNLLLYFLVVCIIINSINENRRPFIKTFKEVPIILYSYIIFLILFPFVCNDKIFTINTILGQWMPSVLAWFCAMTLVGQQKEIININKLCTSHSVIVIAFFVQLAFAVSGLYSEKPPQRISIEDWRVALQYAWENGPPSIGASIPFPFVGYDEMHGNLGYAGSQVIALASAWYLFCNSAKIINKDRIISLFFITISLLSAIWISSRGAFIFDLIILLIAFLNVKRFVPYSIEGERIGNVRKKSEHYARLAVASALIIFASLVSQTILKDERWLLMKSKIEAGWMVKDPVSFMCNGFRPGEQEEILEGLQIQNPEISQKIMAGFDQDAGRAVLLQVGWQLVKENPWGIDGSRQSYEKAIAAKCGGQPTHNFAHAHNGWINLALSFGWLGAGLYFALLMQMAIVGWRHASSGLALPWSSALFLVAFFWIIRGLTDACYQDHYIQMQGVLLGYLYARTKQEASPDAEVSTA
jgi:hypothetical protein